MTSASKTYELHSGDITVLDRHENAERRLGMVIEGRWRLDRVVGSGGMGAVYRARHRNGRVAAIKVMHSELAERADLRERFFTEGRVANLIAHPGAVAVLDDGVTDAGEPFLVMELLEGETLWDRRLRDRATRDIAEALIVTNQILEVLIVAHAAGVVHRDIKPENVFVTREGEIKILDFGVARIEPGSVSGRTRRSNTQQGDAVGTPAFMAPEQARGELTLVDARSDIWSVGATLFFLLTGRCVHQAVSPMDELIAAMNDPAPSLAEVAPDMPPCLVALVDRALAYDPERRFRDAISMQTAVQAAYAELCRASTPSLPDIDEPTTPSFAVRRRSGVRRVMVGAALCAAAAATSLFPVPWTESARALLGALLERPVRLAPASASPIPTATSTLTRAAAPLTGLPSPAVTSDALLAPPTFGAPDAPEVIPVHTTTTTTR
jgi:serine/threonine-protein kinase